MGLDRMRNEDLAEKQTGKQEKKAALYIILIITFSGCDHYVGIRLVLLTELARKPEELREWLIWLERVIIFIGLQVLQVVVAAIPGEFTQLVGVTIRNVWHHLLIDRHRAGVRDSVLWPACWVIRWSGFCFGKTA